MSRCNTDKCSGYLCRDICRGFAPCDPTLPRISKRYGWIEVCPGNGTESEDDCYQRSARCEGVGEERESDVARYQPFPHDPRADNGGEQEERSGELCNDPS
jgi:hypothetical protein